MSIENSTKIEYYWVDLRNDITTLMLKNTSSILKRHNAFVITPNDIIMNGDDGSLYHYNAIDKQLFLITNNILGEIRSTRILRYKDGILFADNGIKYYSVLTKQTTSYPFGFLNFPSSQVEGTGYCLVTSESVFGKDSNVLTFYT
jgi:hypothetical protein